MTDSVASEDANAQQLLPQDVSADAQVQALLATRLQPAVRPPSIAATPPPDQDIPLNKLKFDVDVDPRRVLSYMYNVTAYFKKCVRDCTCVLPYHWCLLMSHPGVYAVIPTLPQMNPADIPELPSMDLPAKLIKMATSSVPRTQHDNHWWNMATGAPLQALNHILHSCFKEQLKDFSFYPSHFVGDAKQGVSMYTWSSSEVEANTPIQWGIRGMRVNADVRCCVFVLEPWCVFEIVAGSSFIMAERQI
jgi:hypothetical protein